MTKRIYILPIVAALLASCGGGGASVGFSSLERKYAQEFCEYYVRCYAVSGVANTAALLQTHPGTYGTCTDLLSRSRIANLGSFEASIDAGRIVYDGAAAATCLARIGLSCTPLDVAGRVEPACNRVFQGAVASGGTCARDEECAGAAYCDMTGAPACGGTCKATVSVGAACNSSNHCANDAGGTMECTTTAQNATAHCVLTHYVSADAGEACGDTDVDGDDREFTSCSAGLFCRLAAGLQTGTCTVPLAVGAACVQDVDACEGDAVCVGAPGAQTCRAITVMTHVGDACDEPALITCNPLNRLQCVSNVCALVGAGTLGQACRPTMTTDCNAGLYCLEGGLQADSCQNLLPNGTLCPNGDVSCESGYCDDQTTPASPVCAVAACP